MASRRDQLQSHQFLAQRVISALVMRETDPAQSPLRRGIGAVFAGVMISVMVAAGFGVYGLLTKVGSDKWKTNNSVVIDKDSGASFVYQDGELHPMLNYASALLATGAAPRAVFHESDRTLSSVPRGVLLGIAGAPDSLPAAAQVLGAPWTLCADGSATTLGLGAGPARATPLGERGLLVGASSTGSTYLIWHGTRYAVAASVLPALFGAVTPTPAGAAWLDSIPEGPDIAPMTIPGSGAPSPAAPAYAIGELLSTPVGTGGLQYWQVTAGGLAPVTELEMDVAVSQGASKPTQITTAAATAIHRSTLPAQSAADLLPPKPPTLAVTSGQRCAVFADADAAPTISLGGTAIPAGVPTGSRAPDGTALADRVAVPPGHVAVVRVMAAAGSATSGYYLVTDLGIRDAVASDDVLKMLGYPPSAAVAMPAGLVQLIPAGPALDPTIATTPVTGGG
ncbi:MAG TPA: type VII secretion protein EccB [Micromonosporaceae bacterium]|jgi:type VII secretion protein EccB